MDILSEPAWRARERAHHARVDALTADHLARRAVGASHPVRDFLFVYYRWRPAWLRRWHPGIGVGLAGATQDRLTWRHYSHDGGSVGLDVSSFIQAQDSALRFIDTLLTATASRAPQWGCFGLHEWAMVHGQRPGDLRHASYPLRLGPDGAARVLAWLPLRCTHFDAYRFFTDSARGLNHATLTRESQTDWDQPGCLHATMDLYKWCCSLTPAVPSELTMDCLELAIAARDLDMRAAPYDLSALGYSPLLIETAQGRAEYVARQRQITRAGAVLRDRLITVCRLALASAPPAGSATVD